MYFRPLRVFFPMSGFLLLAAFVVGVFRSIARGRLALAETEVILFVTSLMVLVIGLLADLIVAQRRDIGESVAADTSLDDLIRLEGMAGSALSRATYQPVSEPNGGARDSAAGDSSTDPPRHAPPPAPVASPVHP